MAEWNGVKRADLEILVETADAPIPAEVVAASIAARTPDQDLTKP